MSLILPRESCSSWLHHRWSCGRSTAYREHNAWIPFSYEAGARADLLTFQRPCQDQKLIKLVSDPRESRELGKNQIIQIDKYFRGARKRVAVGTDGFV